MNTIEGIRKEATEIQEYCEIVCSENPDEIQERIRILTSYLARTAFMLKETPYTFCGKNKKYNVRRYVSY